MSISDKLTTIAANEQKVFRAGRKAEYDAFWDSVQAEGKRTSYAWTFAGTGWTSYAFNPKYPIAPTNATSMFQNLQSVIVNSNVKKIDFSNCKYFYKAFYGASGLLELGNIDARKESSGDLQLVFYGATRLHTIDKLIVSENLQYYQTFYKCSSLANITIDGIIGNSINFLDCPLTVESVKNIIKALKNYAGTGAAYTRTIKFNEVCWNNLGNDNDTPTGVTWREYVTSLGWNT